MRVKVNLFSYHTLQSVCVLKKHNLAALFFLIRSNLNAIWDRELIKIILHPTETRFFENSILIRDRSHTLFSDCNAPQYFLFLETDFYKGFL